MTCSVVIPVRDGGDAFVQSLNAVRCAHPAPDEIIVVVDGADRDACRVARAGGARVIAFETPRGPAAARNAGAAAAHGDLLLFVDADVLVPPDVVARVTGAFDRRPPPVAVFGSYDDEPGDRALVSQYRNLLHHYVHQTSSERAYTFWSGCGAIDRVAFLSSGGFDETITAAAVEDIELGWRLSRAGHEIRLDKALQVKHLKRWTIKSVLYTDVWLRAVPWTRLILRTGRPPHDLNLRAGHRASVALTGLLGLAVLAVPAWPAALAVAGGAGAALLACNAGFYAFLVRERGVRFAVCAVAWHWIHYACAGVGFTIGVAQEAASRLPSHRRTVTRGSVLP